MWNEPNPDPGGGPPEGSSKSSDIKGEHQQILVAQLKEMLSKQEQSTVTHEKVEEYINSLSKMKAKKSKTKRDDSSSKERGVVIASNKMERVNLLKQQLEQNKARLAERGKSQKGIEEMVTQLQAQLNDSQQLIPANLSNIDQKTIDYNKSTSQEELYNILVIKERKLTELLNRTQKQEATILDLQENLREKDSVIDARTKAITLMSDSLSKKGKHTLDTLDETKEQMRMMQENFVKLESDMKARQLKLLEDLKIKNLEIAELQELNEKLVEQQKSLKSETEGIKFSELVEQLSKLKEERESFVQENTELKNRLQDAQQDINRLKNVGVSVPSSGSSDSEIAKLKKQLEESNKNMIKTKAQSKSKIKELTKKIESFKKMNDANALIIDLQNENTKLSEKIAELEEEKGNMQLKMVESTESTKEIVSMEEHQEMLDKLQQHKVELEEKDKIITLLDSDIISLNEEIKSLKEKLSTYSHLQNVQVTSEIKSIQIEEQLDELENEKQQLRETVEIITTEKKELEQRIEELIKEKQDLGTKLENYIQENIELIDKLEKLSAEKVSSAESIEIVEGLTQQEKIELAAYQKHLEVNLEGIKSPDEDASETPQELNESVLQLNEDSAELLKKIEMFNVERKEVMGKMEILKEENNNLILKISEIENSRDVLADTYEQLQSEKEELQVQNDELLKKIEVFEAGKNKDGSSDSSELVDKLREMESAYDGLLKENENLKANLKQFDMKVHEKAELDSELRDCRLKIEDLEHKLKANVEDLTNYQSIIEENKNELVNSAKIINELQAKLAERENDIKELNVLINDLNVVVADLQNENEKLGSFELMESQVEELKMALNSQIEQAQDYAEEISFNNNVIADLKAKLEDMNRKILDTEHEMEVKNIEMERIKTELLQKDDVIKNLQDEISKKDEKINIISTEMKDKFLTLQKQLDGNTGSLEQKIDELTSKNKEQLEKMKKIAANLKKKTQAYQDLEEQYHRDKEKWETETNKQEFDQLSLLTQVKDLKEEINNKTVKLEESEARIRDLTIHIQNLEQELHNSVTEMRRKQEKMNEVSLKQELSSSLHEDFEKEHGNKESANEEKIRELELIIETNEADLVHYRERLQKLEEELARSVEDRELYQNKMTELEEKITVSSRGIEEKILLQETLEQKLEEISGNNEELLRKLEESVQQTDELLKKSKGQEEFINKLKVKLKKAHEKVTQLKAQQQSVEELEAANAQLKKHLVYLESNQKHVQEENEALHKQNQNDYEKIEADYQGQLEELLRSKNELLMECEKLREELKTSKEKEEEILEELGELKGRMEEIETLQETVRSCKEKELELLKELEMSKRELENIQINKSEDIIEQLSRNLEVMTSNWHNTVKQTESANQQIISSNQQIEILNYELNSAQQQINDLQQQLLVKTAEVEVAKVITQAVDKVFDVNTKGTQTESETADEGSLPTFHWPVQQSVVQDSAAQQPALWSELESQIFSPSDIVDASNNKDLQKTEFEEVKPSIGEQNMPVVEEMLQPKQAYLTYQPGVEASGENDDGWGWGPEEAKLEEEHQNRADFRQAQLEKIQVLQLERENHLEEIKQLQIKSGKLIKKCKELKVLNDQLKQDKQTGDFFNLDDTIQEELKSQIVQLEKKIKEVNADLEKEKTEKGKILKQVDVLTNANERLVENKEIQDSEVFRWKRKYEESQEKLQQFEWNNDGFSEHPKLKPVQTEEEKETIEELQKQVQELSQDNEELQLLLNEQRELRIQAEKSKSTDIYSQISQELQGKIQLLEQEMTIKNNDIQAVLEEKNDIISSLQRVVGERNSVIDSIEEELRNSDDKYKDLEKVVEDANVTIGKLTEKVSELEETINKLESVIKEKDGYINQLHADLDSLKASAAKENEMQEVIMKLATVEEEKRTVEIRLKEQELQNATMKENQSETAELRNNLQQLEEYKIQLESVVNEKDSQLNQLKESYDYYCNLCQTLTEQNNILNKEMEDLKHRYESLQSENQNYATEVSKQKSNYQNLETEYVKRTKEMQEAYNSLQEEFQQHKNEILEQKLMENTGREQQSNLDNLLSEKDNKLNEMENALEVVNGQKRELEGEIKVLKDNLRQNEENYERLVQQMDEELVKKTAELEEKWMVQVDERGNAVAESWKLHLSLVEQDFNSIHEKLKNEVNELEEKCNALVNENNELRKNVDAEIKNEVDRVTSLQQSITDLSKKLSEKEQENATLTEKLYTFEQFETKLVEKESELSGLKLIIDTTQKQFEEKRLVVEEIIKILEKNTPWPISSEAEDIVNEVHRQLGVIAARDAEISQLNEKLGTLQVSMEDIRDKDQEISKLTAALENLQQQVASLPEKEREIERLQKIIEEYAVQIEKIQLVQHSLQEERTSMNITIEDYRQKLESLQESKNHLEELLNKRNEDITILSEQLKYAENIKNDNNKEMEVLQSEMAILKQNYESLQLLQHSQQEHYTVNQELSNKHMELENVKQQVAYLQQHVEILENELQKAREVLQAKEREFSETVSNLEQSRLRELENHYEEIIAAKDIDNNMLRTQLAESVQNTQSLSQSLENESKLKKEVENRLLQLEQRVNEQTTLLEEDEKQLIELKGIIEEQVAKIEDLNKELYEKSKDYDSLVAEMDMGRKAIVQQPSSSKTETSASASKPQPPEDDLSEPVSRAELDLALYMLHQRDVRCEELTVELTSLLEERDTLQLRLSNAIREKEEIRRKYTGTDELKPPSVTSESAAPVSKSSTIFLAATGTELAKDSLEALGNDQNLANKLSELKKVGYKRDKTFVDEQQQRRLQQISIMQQHISEAAKLPPEAAAKLVDASYTLSRDVQSPSKVLLNWLWGRSTPKQNDT